MKRLRKQQQTPQTSQTTKSLTEMPTSTTPINIKTSSNRANLCVLVPDLSMCAGEDFAVKDEIVAPGDRLAGYTPPHLIEYIHFMTNMSNSLIMCYEWKICTLYMVDNYESFGRWLQSADFQPAFQNLTPNMHCHKAKRGGIEN